MNKKYLVHSGEMWMGIVFPQRRPSCSLLQGEERRISETPQGNEWGVCGGLFLGTVGFGCPLQHFLEDLPRVTCAVESHQRALV